MTTFWNWVKVVVAQCRECSQCHWTVHLKVVNFMWHEFTKIKKQEGEVLGDQKLWGLHRHGVTLGAPSVMGTLKRGLSWCHPCSCPDSRHHAVHVKTLAVTWNFFSLKKKKTTKWLCVVCCPELLGYADVLVTTIYKTPSCLLYLPPKPSNPLF